MAKFTFKELIPQDGVISAKLGVDASNPLSDKDIGKAVKLIAKDTYGLCAEGDEVEGFLVAVEPATIDGFSFGSVQIKGRKEVVLDGAVTVGDLVVVGNVIARGTAISLAAAEVKAGTPASQLGGAPYTYTQRVPNTHLWRVISGTGLSGATCIIERVGA
jgi:hypothetical protein